MIDPTSFIHPMACVENSAIGADTKVWQFASVIRGSSIDSNCVIGSSAIIDASTLAEGVHVSPGAVLFPGALICEDVFIGPNVVLCNDFWPRVSKEGWNYRLYLEQDDDDSVVSVSVDVGASIGANATIMPGVKIGECAMIAAGAVVTEDVPRDCLYGRDGSISEIRGTPRRMRTC